MTSLVLIEQYGYLNHSAEIISNNYYFNCTIITGLGIQIYKDQKTIFRTNIITEV